MAKSTPKNYRDNDSSDEGDGDDEEYQDLPQPVTTKSPRRNPEKSLSHHSISQKELSGLNLGITNSGSSDRPRQRKLKTTNYGSFDQDPDDENDEDYADTATNQPAKPRRSAVVVETPSKKGPIRLVLNSDPFTPSPPSSCAASESESEEDDNFEDEDFHSDSPPRPSPGKRRQLRRDAKENAKNTLSSNTRSSKSTTTNTKAKRGAKGKAKSNSKASAPSSANRSSAARNRTYTFPVASTLSQASEADRMMFRWRGQGKSWSEINAEWSRLTGVEPGKSSLSVRFGKLKEKFARMGDKDVSKKPFIFSLLCPFAWKGVRGFVGLAGGGYSLTPHHSFPAFSTSNPKSSRNSKWWRNGSGLLR